MLPKDPRYRLTQQQLTGGAVRAIYLFATELPGMKRADYATWLPLGAYSWGSDPGAHSPGGTGTGGGTSDITVHFSDKGPAPSLMSFSASGRHLDEVLVDHVGEKRMMLASL